MRLSLILLFSIISTTSSLHAGSCLGLVCGHNGQCHQGPPVNGTQTFWCRCDEGYGGLFCDQKCDNQRCSPDEKCIFNESTQKTLCVCKDCDRNGKRPLKLDCPAGFGGTNCSSHGWCYPEKCKNGGKCVGEGRQAKCACPDGFQGSACELDVNECEVKLEACDQRASCMNTHGSYICVCPQGFLPPDCLQPGNTSTVEFKPTVCFVEVSSDYPDGQSMYCQNGGYCDKTLSTCQCPPEYYGSTCEFSPDHPDPCASNPCVHGHCSSFDGGFQCLCDDGYTGSYCQVGKDNCEGNRCAGGSKCINDVDSYFCDCPPGKTGPFCEKLDCSALPMICNHGQCIDNPLSEKSFECQCEPGWGGELCDTDKNECLTENMCMNNGTCVNLPGSFRCDCARGYGGKWCDIPLDMCQDTKCENSGVCMHTSDHSPVCQCKNGFIGKRCEKACPPGFGGVRCDIRTSLGMCSKRGAKCFNGGKCLRSFCVCPPDYTGNQCEVARKDVTTSGIRCSSDPCMNNATCIDVDSQIGYACICQQGFEGDICERRKDLCIENPCANGGVCRQNLEEFTCDCPTEFFGDRCENEKKCTNETCRNGGVCIQDGKSSSSKCECSYGFTGARCEEKINLGMFTERDSLLRSVCDKRKCWERANDGNCDSDCNYAACKFDGGDCSGKREPFSKCRYGNMCADLFANGECNQACNNEDCLYDGMDCMPAVIRCPAKIREYCAQRFANGMCDIECNTAGCGYDGGDCDTKNSTMILTNIRITVQMDPKEFQANGGNSLIEISSALRATVRIQRDEQGPLVFGWDGENEKVRVQMDVKRLQEQQVLSSSIRKTRSLSGVVVYLEVQEACVTQCLYRDAQTVVDVISARLAKKGVNSFGVPISEALVATPPKGPPEGNNFVIYLGVGCVLIVALAGTLTLYENRTRKRRMINAPLWFPPADEEKGRRNMSQHTLLDSYYPPQKIHAGGQQYYQVDYTLPEEIYKIHQEAFGPNPILEQITRESVNIKDGKYRRNVLHFLADNASGKPEDLIVEEAKMCIEAGALVNELDCDENTPLMLAVKARRAKLALVLLRAKADPTIYNKSERSALHEAVKNQDIRMIGHLLTDKRIVRDIDELDRNGMTALQNVARRLGDVQIQMASLLINKGAKIDADGGSRKDSDKFKGRTALHHAAFMNNIQMVEFLVRQNANKDKQDEEGRTPIMLAALEGHETIVRFLITQGASIEVVDALDRSARQLAEHNKHDHVIDIIDHCRPEMHFGMEMHYQAPTTQRKVARATYKSVKKQGKTKKESPVAPAAVSSRDSTHLTPPPSDGSTSSPSPQHFMTATTHATPPSSHNWSPDYQGNSEAFQPQCSAYPGWYSNTSANNAQYVGSAYPY